MRQLPNPEDYRIPGEVGKEFHEAYDAYRAELPKPSREVSTRYHRMKGALIYLREKRKLTIAQIADVKLADVPIIKRNKSN